MSNRNIIRVFEHQPLKLGDSIGEPEHNLVFTERHFIAFKRYHKKEIERRKKGTNKAVYFTLLSDGVKFQEYVGVIKIGNLIIEVLPKVDKVIVSPDSNDKIVWQHFLYKMFRYAADVKSNITSFAPLKHQNNNFLDLYISYFLNEVDYLFKTGLIKKYHKVEANLNSLKGSLQFPKHFSKNIVHQEKIYCKYSVYDTNNLLNQILYKALVHIKKINASTRLMSRVEGLIINFPEVKNIQVSEAFFEKIILDRKSVSYKTSINLAKFILLNLHPDVSNGQNDTLAIMFDMNKLWEVYVYKKLKEELKAHPQLAVKDQVGRGFWKLSKANSKTRGIIADIVITKNDETLAVLDTKWKVDKGYAFPDDDNLKQMFVYNQYYFKENDTKRSALVYPSAQKKENEIGNYLNTAKTNFGECSLIYIPLIKTSQNEIDINLASLKEYVLRGDVI